MSTENIINTLSSFILNPKSIEIMRNNPKLVKMLTNTKTLPSALRLYIRNIAGVTDKITEDFFSKSELAEIKKRVVAADVEGSMGNVRTSGMEQDIPSLIGTNKGAIGYDFSDGFSVKGIFTDPKVNMDMTLGQAVFTRDKKGDIVVNDIHDFHGQGSVGTSYDDTDMSNLENEYRKGFSDRKKEFRPDPYSAETGRFTEEEKQNPFLIALKGRSGSYVDETDEEMKIRAQKAFENNDITAAGYARIIAQLDQDNKGIPIEIDIGKITQKDKYEAKPDFAKYIAQDTGGKFFYEEDGKQIEYPNPGIEYENVGIPSEIRKQAQKYVNQNMATGGRVGYSIGSPEPLEINDREKTIAFDLFQRLKDIEEQYTGERIVGDPSSLNLDTGDKGQETLMASGEFETYADVIDAYERDNMGYDNLTDYINKQNIKIKEIDMDPLGDLEKTFKGATGGRVMLGVGGQLGQTKESRAKNIKNIQDWFNKAIKKGPVSTSQIEAAFPGRSKVLIYKALGETNVKKLTRATPLQTKLTEKITKIVNDVYSNKVPLINASPQKIFAKLYGKPFNIKTDNIGVIDKVLKNNPKYLEIKDKVTNTSARVGSGNKLFKTIKLKEFDKASIRTKLPRVSGNIVEENILGDLDRHISRGGKQFEYAPNGKTNKYKTLKIKDIKTGDILTFDKIKKGIKDGDPRFKEYNKVFTEMKKLKNTPYINPVTKEKITLLKGLQLGTGITSPLHIQHNKGILESPLKNLSISTHKANQGARMVESIDDLKKLGIKGTLPDGKRVYGPNLTLSDNINRLTKFSDKMIKGAGTRILKTPTETLQSVTKLSKPGIMGALKASRFLPVVGAIATPALAAYGLYDAYKKGYTRPDELLASAAFGSGVSLKDKIKYEKSKEPEDKDGLASLMA